MSLGDVPVEVQVDLCVQFLPVREVLELGSTCRGEKDLLRKDPILWKGLCWRDFKVKNGDYQTYKELCIFDCHTKMDGSRIRPRGFHSVAHGMGLRHFDICGGYHGFFDAGAGENFLRLSFNVPEIPTCDLELQLEDSASPVFQLWGARRPVSEVTFVLFDILLNGNTEYPFVSPRSEEFTTNSFIVPRDKLQIGTNTVEIVYNAQSMAQYKIKSISLCLRTQAEANDM